MNIIRGFSIFIIFLLIFYDIGSAGGDYPEDFLKALPQDTAGIAYNNESLPDSGDYTFHSKKVSVEEMTIREKLLVFGYVARADWTKEGQVTVDPKMTVTWEMMVRDRNGLPVPRDVKRLLEREDGNPVDSKIALTISTRLKSAITGKPIEYDHKEFSAGNGYIAKITDPTLLERLLIKKQPGIPRFYYVRLYGEAGVLVEMVIRYYDTTDLGK